jgi:hypothetical protein
MGALFVRGKLYVIGHEQMLARVGVSAGVALATELVHEAREQLYAMSDGRQLGTDLFRRCKAYRIAARILGLCSAWPAVAHAMQHATLLHKLGPLLRSELEVDEAVSIAIEAGDRLVAESPLCVPSCGVAALGNNGGSPIS